MNLYFNYNISSNDYTAKDSDNNTINCGRRYNSMASAHHQNLCSSLTGTSNTHVALPKGYTDLAGYLYALSFVGELPSNEIISELALCTSSVNQARENLCNGAMNVITDIIKRPQLGMEWFFSDNIKFGDEKGKTPSSVFACSSFVKTGKCVEHSVQVCLIHSQKSAADNVVWRVWSKRLGHYWVETKHVVMDSWSYGPAVLKKDAAHVAQEEDSKTVASKAAGREALAYAKELLSVLEEDEVVRQDLNNYIEREISFSVKNVWPETSVVNKRLHDHIRFKRGASSHTMHSGLHDQIRAVGVLRDLAIGMNRSVSIKNAASDSGMVLNAFKERFMKGYLGQRESQ